MTQDELAHRAGTSQATLSAYERGLKAPSLQVAERIVEAAGYRLSLTTEVTFAQHAAPGVLPFWVPDRLWRGRLPECFAMISMPDPVRLGGVARFDLRRRPSRRRTYEKLLRRGLPDELIDWVDGALLVDLAGKGPLVHPTYRGPLSPESAALEPQSPRPGADDGVVDGL
ncbi:MAG: helix-turn-helix domain-containing protein [Nocardioidaceae bacterium]|nr:helix-turn-helix domain-containing protein [Nocardioidaceae bacterium]